MSVSSSLRFVVRQPCRLCVAFIRVTCHMCCQFLVCFNLKADIISWWELFARNYIINYSEDYLWWLQVFGGTSKYIAHTTKDSRMYSISNDYLNIFRICEPCYTNLVSLNTCLHVHFKIPWDDNFVIRVSLIVNWLLWRCNFFGAAALKKQLLW